MNKALREIIIVNDQRTETAKFSYGKTIIEPLIDRLYAIQSKAMAIAITLTTTRCTFF
jgi:hypothetical protein